MSPILSSLLGIEWVIDGVITKVPGECAKRGPYVCLSFGMPIRNDDLIPEIVNRRIRKREARTA